MGMATEVWGFTLCAKDCLRSHNWKQVVLNAVNLPICREYSRRNDLDKHAINNVLLMLYMAMNSMLENHACSAT